MQKLNYNEMTLYQLTISLLSVALIVFPLIAILITSTENRTALALLFIWFPQFLKGTGSDVLSRLLGLEVEIYVFVVILLKTAYCVQQDIGSLILWLLIICLQLCSLPLNRTVERSEPIQVSKRILLGSLFLITNSVRIIVLALNRYDKNSPWYADDNDLDKANLEVYMIIVESFVVSMICARKQLLPDQKSFIFKYSCVFWLYLILNATQMWLFDTMSIIVIVLQILATSIVLAFIESYHSGTNFKTAIKSQARDLSQCIKDIVNNFYCRTIAYIILAGYVIYAADSKLYDSRMLFNTSTVSCGPYHIVNDQWQRFMAFYTNNALPLIQPDISYYGLQTNEMLDYKLLEMACIGQSESVIPTNNYLDMFTLVLGSIPALIMITMVFTESKEILRWSSFWLVTSCLAFISLLCTQFSDSGVFFLKMLHDGEYSRSYTSTGASVLACQIFMSIIAVTQWYSMTEKTRAPTTSISEALTRPSNLMLLLPLIFTIYRMAVSNPIIDYGFNRIEPDYSATVITPTLDSMIYGHLTPPLTIYKDGLIESLLTQCSNGVCVSEIINVPSFVDLVMDQLTTALRNNATDQINSYNDSANFNYVLQNPEPIIDFEDLQYLDGHLWGPENLKISPWITAGSMAFGACLIVFSVASTAYNSSQLKFVQLVMSVFLIAGGVFLFFTAVEFYFATASMGYELFVVWDRLGASLLLASVLGFGIGLVWSMSSTSKRSDYVQI